MMAEKEDERIVNRQGTQNKGKQQAERAVDEKGKAGCTTPLSLSRASSSDEASPL